MQNFQDYQNRLHGNGMTANDSLVLKWKLDVKVRKGYSDGSVLEINTKSHSTIAKAPENT